MVLHQLPSSTSPLLVFPHPSLSILLISCLILSMNISTRLKTELCSLDTNNYSYAKDVSTRNGVKSEHWCTSWGYQFKVLLLRGLKVRRYETFNKLRIFQVVPPRPSSSGKRWRICGLGRRFKPHTMQSEAWYLSGEG
ncbi:hypothetical protein R3W88_011733 [Solanum pinnatisectum]|uniref:Uncharacterized protein n=1 Tax=Solanum pinnatisectum TaxID=50273 RepID=A0AAV9L9F6_9SOLN|nr:hypothetical protein R3W88_011733 [Solanum pinnatisectum]